MDLTAISKAPLFAGFTYEELEELFAVYAGEPVNYDKGGIILRAGEKPDGIGLILSGSANIETTNIWGQRSIITHISAGDIFAEAYAFLDNECALVSVAAAEPTTAVIFRVKPMILGAEAGADAFRSGTISANSDLFRSGTIPANSDALYSEKISSAPATSLDPAAAGIVRTAVSASGGAQSASQIPDETLPASQRCRLKLLTNLLRILSAKNLEMSKRMLHTAPKTIRARVLAYLSEQAIRSNSRDFTIPFDRQQLADHLGVDRSSLSAELSALKRDGILDCRKNHFRLLGDRVEE